MTAYAFSTLWAVAVFMALCFGWYFFCLVLPYAPAAIACLVALWLLSSFGGYEIARRRRQTLLSATLRDDSWLRVILSGRILAAWTSLFAATVAVPVVGSFLLLSQEYDRFLVVATTSGVAIIFLSVARVTQSHLKPIYGICLVAPTTALVTGLVMACIALAIAYGFDVNMASGAEGTLSEAIARARADLRGTIPLIEPVVLLFLVGDVPANWLLAGGGYGATLPLALYLLNSAAAYLGVARIAVDVQAAFHSAGTKGAS